MPGTDRKGRMRGRIITLGGVVAVVLVLWAAAWIVISGIVRTNVEALALADGETSPRVTCGRLDIGGFPFRFDVVCAHAGIVSGDTAVAVADLRASVLVYQPFHVLVFAQGPAGIEDAFTGSRRRLDWEKLEASLRLSDWRIARASVVVDKPVWTDTLAGETEVARAEHAEFHLVDVPGAHDAAAGTAALEVYSTVAGLDAPLFEIAGGQGAIEAEITGLPDDVRTLGEGEPLKRWQAAGGQLKLISAKGNDTNHSFDISGAVALDAAGRPDGQLSIATKGIVEKLGGLVPPELQGLILGAPAEDGSYKQVVTLKSGVVFSGIMPAGVLPALW